MYNALRLTGHPVSYSYLTYQAETAPGAQMMYGAFGTNPYKLGTIMEKNGATVTQYGSAQALDEAMKVGSVAVVSSWNSNVSMFEELHTYTVQKTDEGLMWYNYNTIAETTLQSGKDKGIKGTVQATLETADKHPAFVVGYIVK